MTNDHWHNNVATICSIAVVRIKFVLEFLDLISFNLVPQSDVSTLFLNKICLCSNLMDLNEKESVENFLQYRRRRTEKKFSYEWSYLYISSSFKRSFRRYKNQSHAHWSSLSAKNIQIFIFPFILTINQNLNAIKII